MGTFSEDLKAKQAAGYRLKGGTLQFPVFHVDNVPIEELNLTTRAQNGLKRAQIHTIDKILETDISKMRNLGTKSVREIKNAVLNYSYSLMTQRQQKEFWDSILE